MFEPATTPIILASTSPARRAMLTAVGLTYEAVAPSVDEEAAKLSLRADGLTPRDQADALAELKTLRVSQKRSGFVIGSDQMLACAGQVFDKASTIDEARERLRFLRGKTHELITAVVIARDGVPLWRVIRTPKLTMRSFSDDFLESYLANFGAAALGSVGCYQLESGGAQLFSSIQGDYFSILGLPLLDVLDALRQQGALAS
jgi:septum formation protein